MTYHRFHCTENESDYTYLSEGKYNAAAFSFSNLNLVIKTFILEKVSEKWKESIGNNREHLPSTAILA
jgi:peptide/nickel transport system permease protein